MATIGELQERCDKLLARIEKKTLRLSSTARMHMNSLERDYSDVSELADIIGKIAAINQPLQKLLALDHEAKLVRKRIKNLSPTNIEAEMRTIAETLDRLERHLR